jgi:outer membrane protein OmpA-like peptidoglycan-associated protein
MKKSLFRLFPILFILFSLNEINSQQIPIDKALLQTTLTDFDTIPQTNAKMIIWNSKDSLAFSKQVITDIEGKSSFVVDQGNEYSIKVFKADTSKVFNVSMKKLDFAYSLEFFMFLKVYKRYSQILELDVNFATNSSIIPNSSKSTIDDLYQRLMNDSEINIELASHTDNVGDDYSNMLLSQRRSESVKTYLVNKGINVKRIEAQGYGEKQPKAPNDTRIGRAVNRRTEVRISINQKMEEIKE